MDAYSGYNQIPMHPSHAEKIAFITVDKIYYYNIMSFELKNARATYQCMASKIFQPLIGKIMEVYVDDMLVKSQKREKHLQHLNESFELL